MVNKKEFFFPQRSNCIFLLGYLVNTFGNALEYVILRDLESLPRPVTNIPA